MIKESKKSRIQFNNGFELKGKLLRSLVTRIEPSTIKMNARALFFVSVGRTVRLAVERNRIKRYIRESFRRNQDLFSIYNTESTIAMLFIYYRRRISTQPLPSFCEIDNDIKNILMNELQKYFDSVR